MGSNAYPEADHNPESDSKLLNSHQSTSDLGWCQLGVVEWHDHAKGPNPQTSDESTAEDIVLVFRAGLSDDPNSEDTTSNDGGESAPDSVSQPAIDQGTDPGTKFEDRCQQPLLNTSASRVAVGL